MSYSYDAILTAQSERIEADRARAAAELEASRLGEDPEGAMAAAQRILELDAQQSALVARAQQLGQSRQGLPQHNQYGLSKEEVEAAHNSFGPIKKDGMWVDLTNEQKEQKYAENRLKLRQMRASGQYTDQTR